MNRVLKFLRAIAVWLVVAAWLLFLATGVVALFLLVGTAINATYFPYHPRTPIDRAINQVWQYAVLACLLAAVASSIALALKRRSVASSLIITIWGVFLIYSGWALSVMKPGPEYLRDFSEHIAISFPGIMRRSGCAAYTRRGLANLTSTYALIPSKVAMAGVAKMTRPTSW